MKLGKDSEEEAATEGDLNYLQSTLHLEIMVDKLNIFKAMENVSV